MSGIVLIVLAAVVALYVVTAYNGLIALKNQVLNAWKQIDVQLKRRHDLIPNLVETVKGAMNFERSTLEAVISARNKAVSAQGVAATAKARVSCPRRWAGSSPSRRTTPTSRPPRMCCSCRRS